MSPALQSASPPRKYPECTSWAAPPLDFTNLSYAKQTTIEPSTKDGETGAIRSAWSELLDLSHPMARRNAAQFFESGYQGPRSTAHPSFISNYRKSSYTPGNRPPLHPADEDSGSKPCLGHRPLVSLNPLKFAPDYVWMSYEDVDCRRRDIGSALTWFFSKLENKRKGRDIEIEGEIKDERGLNIDTVCLWSGNNVEWQIIDLACQAYGKVVAALYDSSSDDIAQFVLNHAEAPILFLTLNHLTSVLRLYNKLKYLRSIVLMHSDEELAVYNAHGQILQLAKAWATSLGLEIWGFEEFEKIGRHRSSQPINVPSDAVYSLCYTSGTTGQPKAVILTHGQAALTVSCGSWGMVNMNNNAGITLSVLPLVHSYQRLINLGGINRGGAIGFPNPDPTLFLQDAQLVKPTVLAAVPRLMNKIYQGIIARVAGPSGSIKARLFNHAVKTKIDALRSTGKIDHPFWDRVIFNKIKSSVGGNLATIVCGSAATSPEILDFAQVVLGCRVYNGYGLTETFALSCRVLPYDPTGSFTIGPVVPFCEAKLIDAPELGYFVKPKQKSTGEDLVTLRPRGELCLRPAPGGRCPGYYKDPESTRYTFDSEEWIHTADIAELDECGRFKIIDRRKNIIKLTQGEFVALERVETLYSASPVLSQLFLYGDMTKDYLVAVVVPAEELGSIMGEMKPGTDPNTNTSLKMHILEALEAQAQALQLKGYEKIRNIYITYDVFSVEDGTLTPTLKIKRKEAYEKYKAVIEELYNQPIPVLPSVSKEVRTKL